MGVKSGKSKVRENKRFRFGRNWGQFFKMVDESRIMEAELSLNEMLRLETLSGMSFLDVGSGSGIFSLAARRLGANVYSFDYDPESVECTRMLREKYFPNDTGWKIEEGSALDERYITSLGQFDIVYSWDILHHTGNMWDALNNVKKLVQVGGLLFIAINLSYVYPYIMTKARYLNFG